MAFPRLPEDTQKQARGISPSFTPGSLCVSRAHLPFLKGCVVWAGKTSEGHAPRSVPGFICGMNTLFREANVGRGVLAGEEGKRDDYTLPGAQATFGVKRKKNFYLFKPFRILGVLLLLLFRKPKYPNRPTSLLIFPKMYTKETILDTLLSIFFFFILYILGMFPDFLVQVYLLIF